jgi:hypothetical protein
MKDLLARARHDGFGGRAARAELLSNVCVAHRQRGASIRP